MLFLACPIFFFEHLLSLGLWIPDFFPLLLGSRQSFLFQSFAWKGFSPPLSTPLFTATVLWITVSRVHSISPCPCTPFIVSWEVAPLLLPFPNPRGSTQHPRLFSFLLQDGLHSPEFYKGWAACFLFIWCVFPIPLAHKDNNIPSPLFAQM